MPGRSKDCGIRQSDIRSCPSSAKSLHRIPCHSKSRLPHWPLRSLVLCPSTTTSYHTSNFSDPDSSHPFTQLQPYQLPGCSGLSGPLHLLDPVQKTSFPKIPPGPSPPTGVCLRGTFLERPFLTSHFKTAFSHPTGPFLSLLSCSVLLHSSHQPSDTQ